MSTNTTKTPVNTNALRVWFNESPKRLDALSPAARKTVEFDAEGRSPRGRVHPEARKMHNSRRRTFAYVEGLTGQNRAEIDALRADLIAQGLAGKRGPVKRSVKEALDALNA